MKWKKQSSLSFKLMIFLVRILEENEPLYILDDKIILKFTLEK